MVGTSHQRAAKPKNELVLVLFHLLHLFPFWKLDSLTATIMTGRVRIKSFLYSTCTGQGAVSFYAIPVRFVMKRELRYLYNIFSLLLHLVPLYVVKMPTTRSVLECGRMAAQVITTSFSNASADNREC